MRHFVEGFGKVKQDCIHLGVFVHSSHPVVDCLNELRFTRQSRLESVLEVENDVMLVQVFQHIALWLFLCIRVTNACSQSLGSLPV